MSQVRRRQFLIAAGLAALPLPALAQQEKRVRRIGYFSPSTLPSNAAWLAAFREGMAELRWIEGRDYVIDARYADGVAQAFESLATESVAAQPDLLLTVADTTTRLLAQRTTTIPIVFATILDPMVPGVVASLQRPGGNATGLTMESCHRSGTLKKSCCSQLKIQIFRLGGGNTAHGCRRDWQDGLRHNAGTGHKLQRESPGAICAGDHPAVSRLRKTPELP